MSNKAERPTLQGQRFRTRKRDEKEKFNPSGFRDTILHNFDELNGGLCLKQQQQLNSNNNLNDETSNNCEANGDVASTNAAGELKTSNSTSITTTTTTSAAAAASAASATTTPAAATPTTTTTTNNNNDDDDSSSSEQQLQQQNNVAPAAAPAPTPTTTTDNNKPVSNNNCTKNGVTFDIDAVIKCLLADTKIDYRVYGEQLFDIIIAGGILAPGGSILVDSDTTKQCTTDICLFKLVDAEDLQGIKNFATIFVRLIQRFGYLEKTLEEEFKKIIVFLKAFEADDRVKLAKIAAVLISLGILAPHVVLSGIQDHLVKDGIALEFLVKVLQTWILEKDPNTVWNSMRRAGVDNKLLDFLPPNKRSSDTIIQIFQNNGLQALVNFQKTKESEARKGELQRKVTTLIKNKASTKETIELIRESTQRTNLDDSEIVVLIWKTLMSIVEWNKKEEIVADQAMKHLRTHAGLMAAFSKSAKAQLALIIRVQEYCYDNMNFLKVFHKIIILLYKADVLTEDIIIEWYKRAHSNKGKSVFLEQTKPFIEWLEGAEEESEEE